jgi:hypothetical protein
MAKASDLRKIALSLEGTLEVPHMDRAAFRVARIYATMPPDGKTANLLFSPEEQELRCEHAPAAFSPVPGGWGKMGYTTVTLAAVSVDELTDALRTAWASAQPKKRPTRRKPK